MVNNFCGGYQSPIGTLKIVCSQDTVLSVEFYDGVVVSNSNDLVQKTIAQLEEYFDGQRQFFDLPLRIDGAEFRVAAWQALCEIPYGETITYKKQAEIIGNPNAARAVGSANNKNKIAIIVPCHRVVGANGSMVGYAGGLDKKVWLLEHEKRTKNEKF